LKELMVADLINSKSEKSLILYYTIP
jgi:hypothetical protein